MAPRIVQVFAGALLALSFARPAPAQRVTGDWGGERTRLEDRGVTLSFFYNQIEAAADGFGVSNSSDVFAQFDLERLGAVRNGRLLAHLKADWGRNINPNVGALGDPLDDADGALFTVAQFWYEHDLASGKVQFRVGYLDQQTILDRNAFANAEDRQFMNALLDNNNAVVPLAIGPGAAVFLNPARWLSFVLTASDAEARARRLRLDTAFTGRTFAYFETDLRFRIPSPAGSLTGTYRIGAFLDPRTSSLTNDSGAGRNKGVYLSFDQMIYAEDAADDQGLGLFFRWGRRPDELNRIKAFWSGGAQYLGLLPGRPRDTLGVGFYKAIGSDAYRARIDPDFGAETGYELDYAIPAAPGVVVTPAVQYISRPGARRGAAGVVVGIVRLRLTL